MEAPAVPTVAQHRKMHEAMARSSDDKAERWAQHGKVKNDGEAGPS
jgi:hypothetical protein